MFCNFATTTLVSLIDRPACLAPNAIEYTIDDKTNISKEVEAFYLKRLVAIIVVHSAPEDELEGESCVVVHQEENAYDGSKKTACIGDHSIEFGVASSILITICRFSKDEASVPILRYFLHRYGGWHHHNVTLGDICIRIRKNTLISCDLIIRNEDIAISSKLIPKGYVVFIFHVVGHWSSFIGSD